MWQVPGSGMWHTSKMNDQTLVYVLGGHFGVHLVVIVISNKILLDFGFGIGFVCLMEAG